MSDRRGPRGGGYDGGRGGGGRGGGGRGGGGRGGFDGGRGGSSRGGFDGGRGGGSRGGFDGGRGARGRGRGSLITWSDKPLSLDLPPVKVQGGWKHPYLPENAEDVKALLPRKNGLGTSYQSKIHAVTNHFLVNISPPKQLYRYEIDMKKIKKIKPQEESTGKLKNDRGGAKGRGGAGSARGGEPRPPGTVHKDMVKKILKTLIPKIQREWETVELPKTIGIIHDFSKIVITNKPLETTVALKYIVQHSELLDEDGEECHYEVSFAPAAFEVDLDRVRELLLDTANVDHPELFEIKQVYNILLKNLGGDRYSPYGRSAILKIAEPSDDNWLGEGLMNWKGVSAVCTVGTTWKPFINIDIQNCAIVIGQNVLSAIADILESNRSRADFRDVKTWQSRDFESVNCILKSRKVRRSVRGRPMDKPIKNVDKKPASEIKFNLENRTISVAQYTAVNLGMKLKHPNGPVLELGSPQNTNPDNRVFVPAELCTIKSGQSINRLLPPNATKNMVEKATRKPVEKYNDIMNAVTDLQLRDNNLFREFGVTFPTDMLELKDTRVLAPPELCYGKAPGTANPKLRGRITPSDGQWDVWSHKVEFFNSTRIDAWAILYVGLRGSVNAGPFIDELIRQGKDRGMYFPDPLTVEDARVRDNDFHQENVDVLFESLQTIKQQFNTAEKCFVVCVIPQKGNVVYSQIKQAAERDGHAEILTQCIVEKNFSNANHSVVKNLLLKINSKLGGINHVPIPPPSLANLDIMKVPTLILGIDVNHPSLPTKGRPTGHPSFAAVTGSLDRSGMPYMMHVQAQMRIVDNKALGAAEVIQGLDGIVKNMLIQFRTRTNLIPSRIIVYRDGVGDSQFPEILQVEMGAIRNACSSLSENYKPRITILAVQKRHKVRFFLKEDGRQISRENVPPGTVVDTEIVRADFYLLSHKGMLGTSRPTHYHVLWDDSDFTTDEIQGLTYFLCYMYSRCNRSVSYPAPTYYAHWAAMRANNLATGYKDWDGTQESLDLLNKSLARSEYIKKEFPMHFI